MKMLIKGGSVIDGSGGPAFRADVQIDGDRIVEVGAGLEGGQVLEASGLTVAPGFIDLHSHSDRTIFTAPLGNSKVLQGVTTEVIGNCGIGLFPVSRRRLKDIENYLETLEGRLPPGGIAWQDMAGFAAEVAKLGLGRNLACLTPHGTLRIAAMGPDDRPPTADEFAAMQALLSESLEQGAWGMSTGLIYPPGSFAAPDELAGLAAVLAAHNGIYTSHVRGESKTLLSAVEEVIEIAATTGVRAVVSHLKAIGRPYWGRGLEALGLLAAARGRGVDVWADQYPYEATSTTLLALLPGWVQDGGVDAMLARLADSKLAAEILTAVEAEMTVRGGPERIKIANVRTPANKKYVGLSLAALAADRGLEPAAAALALIAEESGAVNAIYFSLSEQDLEGIMGCDFVAVGSDGSGLDPEIYGGSAVHPRNYGTFPRVLGRYVREKGLITLEAAIRKMSGLPAAILGMRDRGLILPGQKADLVVFDPGRIADRADFARPHQYPDGIEYVLVNGTLAVAGGKLTGEGRGEVLRR